MRRGRKRGSRLHRVSRFPFARLITRCQLPCLRRYGADSDTNSDIQTDSLLYCGQASWPPLHDSDASADDTSAHVTSNTPANNTQCSGSSGSQSLADPSPIIHALPSSAWPNHLITLPPPPPDSPGATQQDVTITNSAPSLTGMSLDEDSTGASSSRHDTRSALEEPRSSGSVGDVRFGLQNRLRLPLTQQYHCWQHMFGQHRNSEFAKRESGKNVSATLDEETEVSSARSSRGERSRSTSESDFQDQRHSATAGQNSQPVQNFQIPQRLLPSQASCNNNIQTRPSRSSWIMDLPLSDPSNHSPSETLESRNSNPFTDHTNTMESTRSTSSGSSFNQSLFEGTNPFSRRAPLSDADNWLLSIRSTHAPVNTETVVTLNNDSNLGGESSTDPPLHVVSNPFRETDNIPRDALPSSGEHEETQRGAELRNPLAYLFTDPFLTINSDTLRSSSSSSSASSSGNIQPPMEFQQLESLLSQNRDTFAMLFDASRSQSSRSRSSNSSNTSSLLRSQGSIDLQDWYFYDPRMAPGHHRGHLMQNLINLPGVVGPPSYDEIIQQQMSALPPYIDNINDNIMLEPSVSVIPQEAPPPYSAEVVSPITEPPPPYESGSERGSSIDGSSSLGSTYGHMILQQIYLPTANDDTTAVQETVTSQIPDSAAASPNGSNLQSPENTSNAIGAQSGSRLNDNFPIGSQDVFGSDEGSVRPSPGLFGGRPPVRWNGGMRVDRWASTRAPNWLS